MICEGTLFSRAGISILAVGCLIVYGVCVMNISCGNVCVEKLKLCGGLHSLGLVFSFYDC